jgi:CDP-diacylglycerol--glycerol-3-phosphate 3-phosphatidyltransferase
MFTLSNSLSLLRLPLAFVFLSHNPTLRIIAIILAMFTDSIDGYIARRSKSVSRFGAILDPAMDKFFVYFALTVLCIENRIELWQAFAMVARDFFLMIFAIYLLAAHSLKNYEYRSIRWGKVSTALQFIVLLGLCINIVFPVSIFFIFILLGSLAFVELFYRFKTT